MMGKQVNVEEWIAMFRELGLSDEQMNQWHRIFEARHPEAHQNFLEWLGLQAEAIANIRKRSR